MLKSWTLGAASLDGGGGTPPFFLHYSYLSIFRGTIEYDQFDKASQ